MKKVIFTLLTSIACASTYAQTVSNFENITLATNSYNNGTNTVSAVTKFKSGNASFVNGYDTSFGGFWGGCAISNIKDSINGSYSNQYASVTNGGYNASANYATMYIDYNASNNKIILDSVAKGRPVKGTYITNSTWAYKEILNGGGITKKFGGATGNDPDYYYVTFGGWYNGAPVATKVNFYLADFRDANNANDYIVKDWRWVDLSSLGNLDSLYYEVGSSDTGAFGINTPAYFCIDNFTTTDIPTSLYNIVKTNAIACYPNPATDYITVQSEAPQVLFIVDAMGAVKRKVNVTNSENKIDISNLPSGVYFIKTQSGVTPFTKM